MSNRRKFDQPSVYQIRVNGRLDPKWSDWFEGFTFEYIAGDTLLTGPVADQAALHGLLAKIRDLSLALLSVKRMERKEGRPERSTK
jgi:hypothetical protein